MILYKMNENKFIRKSNRLNIFWSPLPLRPYDGESLIIEIVGFLNSFDAVMSIIRWFDIVEAHKNTL